MKYTQEKSFKLPEYTDIIDIFDINENFEKIDVNLATVETDINNAVEKIFNHYLGLQNATTEFLADGSIVVTNTEATITTVFGNDSSGNKLITETVRPVNSNNGSYIYEKTTTIYKETSTTNKRIVEEYSLKSA